MASSTSQAQGAASEAQGIAVSDLLGPGSQNYLNEASSIQNLTGPALSQYIAYLEKLSSGNPVTEMQAIGPQVANITAQAQGAKQQIANLGRGGEKDYLSANIDQQSAASIGNALNTAVTQAQQQLGVVGEQGIGQYLAALGGYNQAVGEAGNLEIASGNLFGNLAKIQAQSQGGLENLFGQLGSSVISNLPDLLAL